VRGQILTALGALTISTAPILFALSEAPASLAAALRFAYALPPLLLICGLRGAARESFAQRGWIPVALLSGAFFASDILLWHRSIELVGAGPATLLANTQVIWITLFGLVFLVERPGTLFWLALPVLSVGMALLCGVTPEGFARTGDARGLLFGAASGAMYAGAILCLRHAQQRARIAPEAALTVQLVAALGIVLASLSLEGETLQLRADQHLWLLALAWGPQVVGWMLITAGIRHLAAYRGALLLLLQPVSSLLLGWLLLSQALTPLRWLGALLVTLAIAAALRGSRSR
jgi:drug/metabolite transporter (DMT)-like permease